MPAVGVRLATGSPIYFSFADIVQDNKYSEVVVGGSVDAKINPGDQTFDGGIKVASLTYYDALVIGHTVPIANVVFVAPEATVVLTDATGISLGDTLEITLVSGSGQVSKRVTVRTSGQVSIK